MGGRRPPIFWIGTVVLLGAVAVLTWTVLRGDDSETPVLRVDLIDDALDAIVSERGADVVFYEVNASPALVNLFVQVDATDGEEAVVAYVYTEDDGLGTPSSASPAEGAVFGPSQIEEIDATVLDPTLDELESSLPRLFTISGPADATGTAATVQYRIVMESLQGGSLSVLVTPDGEILGSDAE